MYNVRNYKNIIPINKALWGSDTVLDVVDNGYGAWGMQTLKAFGESVCSVETITIEDMLKQYDIKKIDILKIDIEGAEIDLFKQDCSWLKDVKVLGIELHDRMVEGCSNIFFKKISEYPNFVMSVSNEDSVFVSKS